jgi:hypothetical protein
MKSVYGIATFAASGAYLYDGESDDVTNRSRVDAFGCSSLCEPPLG